jgi:hypothetical protein
MKRDGDVLQISVSSPMSDLPARPSELKSHLIDLPPGATCISASSPHSLTCEIRVVHFSYAGCRVCWFLIHFASRTCMSVLFFNTPLIYIRVFFKREPSSARAESAQLLGGQCVGGLGSYRLLHPRLNTISRACFSYRDSSAWVSSLAPVHWH